MRVSKYLFVIIGLLLVLEVVAAVVNWTPVAVEDDALVRMPGTQPGQVTLESPGRCFNCHAGYNQQVEPGFNWQGSMMAQAARDFVFWACMTVAAQDSIWAVGRPNATDICERCHFPQGWLEGRSDPTNASLMTGADFDGIHCDACHRQFDPFFEGIYQGTREGNDWLGYWDETNASDTPSQAEADLAYQEDSVQAQGIRLFNGGNFFSGNLPTSPGYIENGAGQYYVSGGSQKREPFADADAKHQQLYSRFHKSKYFCSSCHDVSNPALANLAHIDTQPGDGTTILPSEENPAYSYFHVERTFSEFRLSDYGQDGGSEGIGPFDPAVFNTSHPNNRIASCQDCHMRDVVGVAANKSGILVRPDESIEHPKSGQPLHDLTGGNAWVSYVLASAVPGSPNYDAANELLLDQGPAILTLDLSQGEGINPEALLAGVDRAKQQLELAAEIENLSYSNGVLSFRIQNNTGHKLISGFPEGRRMFINIKCYSGENLQYEVNPYDYAVGTLKGLDQAYSPNSPALAPGETHYDELVYEMKPTSTLTGEAKTFHFALATGRYKDNRIPPKGFRIDDADDRLAEPVWHGVVDTNYFTPEEYSVGCNDVSVAVGSGIDAIEVSLYYQTTSREYIEFLRDEILGTPERQTLPSEAYIAQTDSFFTQLRAWGNTIWDLWDHNKNVPGAAPYLMAQATMNIENPCDPPIPTLLYCEPGDGTVTLTWSDEHSVDPNVIGYRVYYDQGGKAQLVDEVGLTTSYVDSELTIGQTYAYKVTVLYAECESDFSNILYVTSAPLTSIGEAKLLADGSWVYIDDAVVTAWQSLGWGCVYVESAMRTAGIKLITAEDLLEGQNVKFTGMLSYVGGEWQITSVSLVEAVPGVPMGPTGTVSRSICSDPTETLTYLGQPTSGLLMRVWGTVTSTIPAGNIVYLDDGGGFADGLGSIGLRVQMPTGALLPAAGDFLCVSGISRV